MADPGVLLTQDQVNEWRMERDRLVQQMGETKAKLDEVERKLAAAEIFIESVEAPVRKRTRARLPPDVLERLRHPPEPNLPMSLAALDVIRRHGGPMRTRLLKRHLLEAGYPENRLGNYFYTMLARQLKRGNLEKGGEKYALTAKGLSLLADRPEMEDSDPDE